MFSSQDTYHLATRHVLHEACDSLGGRHQDNVQSIAADKVTIQQRHLIKRTLFTRMELDQFVKLGNRGPSWIDLGSHEFRSDDQLETFFTKVLSFSCPIYS